MVSWGIVAACFMFVQGPTSFYILRFLLGITEAGFFPGVILFLTYWIPARHLSRARGYFYMGIAIAGILGNPLSGGLLELNGVCGSARHPVDVPGRGPAGRRRRRLGVLLPDRQARRTRSGCRRTSGRRWRRPSRPRTPPSPRVTARRRCWPRSGNWRVWYFALIYFCIQIAVYGVTFFLPTQVTAITGQKLGFQASLVTAIPWVFALAAVAFFPGLADRTRKHRPIGCALLLATAFGHLHLRRAERHAGAGDRRALAGRDGVRGHAADLLDPADRVHDRVRRRRRHRPDQLPGQPGRVPGPDHARLLQRDRRRQRRPVLAGRRSGRSARSCSRSPALFKKANEIEAGHLDEVDAVRRQDLQVRSRSMKALVLRGDYDIAVEERPDPRPGSSEVVVEVIATGICGSDFHGYSGENGRRHPGPGDGARDGRPDRRAGLGRDRTRARPAGHRQPGDGLRRLRRPARAGRRSGAAARWCSGWPRRSRRRSPTGSRCRPRNIVTLPEEMPAELGALVEPLAVGLPRRPPRRGRPPGTGCWSSAAGRSGRPACSRPGGSGSTTWPSPMSVRPGGSCAPGSARRRSIRPPVTWPRRSPQRWAVPPPWWSTRSGVDPDGRRRPGRLGPRRPDRAGRHGLAAAGPGGVRDQHRGAEPDRVVHLQRRPSSPRPPPGWAPCRTGSSR